MLTLVKILAAVAYFLMNYWSFHSQGLSHLTFWGPSHNKFGMIDEGSYSEPN